ncbi:membrane protein insertase YidC [Clostridium gasigenes]|uniref:YidC/Oxa1 family membrane protein insertase n=1 Tax=Clostridium gasigenes TaxID=94869 RepID=A0A1H0V6W9_9CLOT|nr:membrane protein insertase YidC [Clostridium gasigenes]MBU3090094.1 membrane protein insertase YidC [Clostridium gasigenes]SDP74113.1 YidC/Oxa1 family membrane protein insertase [Clostridium gasigenes]
MLDFIVKPMTAIFQSLHLFIEQMGVTGGVSYVLAIFIFTLAIRLLILPLTIKGSKSNAKMQEIQPELKKIQEKYKGNPEKLQVESSKLMKDNKVSMLGGCIPSLLPLPILFALYYVFREIPNTGNVSFLWISDIFKADKYHILPVLAALGTYLPTILMTKSMPKNDSSPMNMGTMNIMMSGMMGVMAWNFQSILVMYWIIGGVIQLVQTYFVNYLPYQKKLALKTKEEALIVSEKVKKATPKTRKR